MKEYFVALDELERHRLAVSLLGAEYFYPTKPAPAQPARIMELGAEALMCAEPYYCSPDMCTLIAAAYPSVPFSISEQSIALVPEMLPSYAGFFWFSRPIPLAYTDRTEHVVALSWTHTEQGVWFGVYTDIRQNPHGWYVGSFEWSFGDDGRGTLDNCEIYSEKKEGVEMGLAFGKLMSATLSLLHHEHLVEVESGHLSRQQARKRQRQHLDVPVVKVVQLKRPSTGRASSGDGADVEWSCRWVVRGHWRNQWYPKLARHQPRWIPAYLKGPEDKPLREYEHQIFVVS